MKKEQQFVLIAFLTLLSSISFTVGTFWLFKWETTEFIGWTKQALSRSVPPSDALEFRSVIANERVASYSDDLFWVAALQAGGAVLSLVILIPTLLYTRRAALAAKTASDEARSANEQTRDLITLTRQTTSVELQPYVSLHQVQVDETPSASTVVLLFKNFGRSPALDFKAKLQWGLQPDLSSSEVPNTGSHSVAPCTLMPDQERRIRIVEETDKKLNAVRNKTANFLICVEYELQSPYFNETFQGTQSMYIDAYLLERHTAGVMASSPA